MQPILTLTLNPAIDSASEADEVRPIHKVRTRNERFDPGGGGINVSRVVRELGGDTLAVYLAGGATGPVFDALIETRKVPRLRVDIEGHTRISQTVFETSSGREFRFVPEGPLVNQQECERLLDTLRSVEFDWLVASGSLPRGAPTDFYTQVADVAPDARPRGRAAGGCGRAVPHARLACRSQERGGRWRQFRRCDDASARTRTANARGVPAWRGGRHGCSSHAGHGIVQT